MNRLILLLVSIFVIVTAGCGGSGIDSGIGGSSGSSPGDSPPSDSPARGILAWNAPSLNADGSPLTDLAGYKIYYGPSRGNYTGGSVNVGLTPSFDTQALPPGYYCFVVVAYNSEGKESTYSNETCTTL